MRTNWPGHPRLPEKEKRLGNLSFHATIIRENGTNSHFSQPNLPFSDFSPKFSKKPLFSQVTIPQPAEGLKNKENFEHGPQVQELNQ